MYEDNRNSDGSPRDIAPRPDSIDKSLDFYQALVKEIKLPIEQFDKFVQEALKDTSLKTAEESEKTGKFADTTTTLGQRLLVTIEAFKRANEQIAALRAKYGESVGDPVDAETNRKAAEAAPKDEEIAELDDTRADEETEEDRNC